MSALSNGHPADAGPPPAANPLPVCLLSSRKPGTKPNLELAAYLYLPTERIAPKAGEVIRETQETIHEAQETTEAGETIRNTCAPDEPGNDVRPRAPGLVVGHGAGSQAARHEEFCREACRQGFVVLALDFRGHGNSMGTGDGPLEQDVLAAVHFLRDHPAVDGQRICYRGSSMGGFYGLKAQPEAGFAALVLLCPAGEDVILDALDEQEDAGPNTDTEAPDTENDTEGTGSEGTGSGGAPDAALTGAADIPRWNKPRLRAYFQQQDSRLIAARVHCPVLLVHARPDTVVPFAHSLLLTQHLPTDTTLLALAKGSHTSAQHDPTIHTYTIAWLRERTSRAATGEIQAH